VCEEEEGGGGGARACARACHGKEPHDSSLLQHLITPNLLCWMYVMRICVCICLCDFIFR